MAQNQNANDDFVNSLMDFDPQNLSVFKEPEKKDYNVNIYKTNPVKFSKSEDGHYRSKVRIIYNPFSTEQSIIRKVSYALTDANGFFMADSKLSTGDRSCPIFTAWKKVWFNKNKPEDERKAFCKEVFQQNDENYVLVQILEDENQPDLVGQFKVWKLPKAVYDIMEAKMNPKPESKKKPVAIMDYLFGKPLEIDVAPGPDDPKHPERKQREISYSLCSFADDSEPIRKTDNTPLFTEDELELIETYMDAKAKYEKAKEADKAKKLAAAQELVPQVRGLYKKALDYLRENCLDIVEEVGYKEWSPELSQRVAKFIANAVQFIDPKTVIDNPLLQGAPASPEETKQVVEEMQPTVVSGGETDDLPF